MQITTIMRMICSIVAIALAQTPLLEALIPGNGVNPFLWHVEAHPGGPRMILNGTVQEVHAQLTKINPNWKTEFAAVNRSPFLPADHSKRDEVLPFAGFQEPNCGTWPMCSQALIKTGVKELNGDTGTPYLAAGPGNCARVNCNYGASIWWCNDYEFDIWLVDYAHIALGAQKILDKCTYPKLPIQYTGGQVFLNQPYKWNVIVRYDETC